MLRTSMSELLPNFFANVDLDIIPEEELEFPKKQSSRSYRRKKAFWKEKRKKEISLYKLIKEMERGSYLDCFDSMNHANKVRVLSTNSQMKEFLI